MKIMKVGTLWYIIVGLSWGIIISVKAVSKDFESFSTLINNPPVIDSTGLEVYENQPEMSLLGQVQAYDIDPGDTLTMQIVFGDPDGIFLLNNDGTLQLASGKTLDTESTAIYELTVEVSDGLAITQGIVTVNVLDVNEAPSFIATSSLNTLEDQGMVQIPNFASELSDGDSELQMVTFQVSTSNPEYFLVQPTIDEITGDLSFQTTADLNGATDLFITLYDDGGTINGGIDSSFQHQSTLTIEPVNDAPYFDIQGDLFVSSYSPTQTISQFVFNIQDSDPEVAQNFTFEISNNNSGLFIVDPYIEQLSDLVFTPTQGINGSAEVTLRLVDDGGTLNGGDDDSVKVFTITIGEGNLPPSFNKGPDIIIDEDAGPLVFPNWATQIDDGNGGTQNLTFIITSDNNALFQNLPSITPDGTLSFETYPNMNGRAEVRVLLKDDGGTTLGGLSASPEQNFIIDVLPVNDPPAFTYVNLLQLAEDFSEVSFGVTPTPIPQDELNQIVNYSISPDPSTVPFVDINFDPTTGQTTINSVADSSGQVTIIVTADDGQTENNIFTQQLFVQVSPENDPPIVSNNPGQIEVNQNSRVEYTIPPNTFFDPEDGPNLFISVDFEGETLPPWIEFDSSTRTLIFYPDESTIGNYVLNIRATDQSYQSTSVPLDVVVLLVTSIEKPDAEQINLYPNPSIGKIQFEKSLSQGPIMVRLFQSSGKTIESWNYEHLGGQFYFEENVSTLPQGIYFLEVATSEKKIRERFVKR